MRMLTPDIPLSGEFIVNHWQEIAAPQSMLTEAVTGRSDTLLGRFQDVQDGDRDPYLYVAKHRQPGRVRAWLGALR
jgi:hypothetical protein